MFFESNMAFQTQTLSSEQLQALFESLTAQQSQCGSSFHLPHLRPDQQGETPLDTQLKVDGEAGEDEWCQGYDHQATERLETKNN